MHSAIYMRLCLILPFVHSITTDEVLREIERDKSEFLQKNEKIDKNFRKILEIPASSFLQLRGEKPVGPAEIDVKAFFAEPEKMIQQLSQVNQEIQNMKFK